MKKIALQLYSVKNSLEKDFEGTLKAISEMGYDEIEFYGGFYGKLSAQKLKEMLDFYGLDAISAHLDLDELNNNLDYHLSFLEKLDCKMVVCSFAEPKSAEEAENLGKNLLELSEKCIIKGFEFAYHNHAFEIERKHGDNTFFDITMSVGDPLVLAQLDVGWLKKAGVNPQEFIRKYAGRVPSIHLKQFLPDGGKITTLENGIVDIEECIKTAKLMGTTQFIVEQDTPITDELTDAKKNIEYLKSLKI